MDKQWMKMDRRSNEYDRGVEGFIKFGISHSASRDSIRCPCTKCGNIRLCKIQEVRDHLFFNGIDQSYTKWIWHGEDSDVQLTEPGSSEPNVLHEFVRNDNEYVDETVKMVHEAHDEFLEDPNKFEKMLSDAERPLYPNCEKYTQLSSIVKLYNLKAKYGWSDTSFNELLSLLSDMLPKPSTMLPSIYEAKKTMRVLGMTYEKIHACPNNCVLYRKELENAVCCPICGKSRWKSSKNERVVKDGVPAKVLWYFSPIPRFRRMFRNKQTAKDLVWHAYERTQDSYMRHPADSPSWKLVDHSWPAFADDPRNLRLAISADGINPHRTLSSTYSCWPVVMVTYNLPPWKCMKRKFMMLTMLISGPTQPGNNIDVYLSPLIDDLKILWHDGIHCYDALRSESFKLKAVLLWTINDFPAYGNLCGCSTKGYKACPICGENTDAVRLKHSKTMAYMGHRKFLPMDHQFRKQKKAFNGEQEFGYESRPLTGDEILRCVQEIPTQPGKGVGHGKRKDNASMGGPWKKRSIFFDLEYWKSLYVRHCLDVMHIEKNVCMNLIGTLLDIPVKTRDGLNARLDLEAMKIRPELVPEKSDNIVAVGRVLPEDDKREVMVHVLASCFDLDLFFHYWLMGF